MKNILFIFSLFFQLVSCQTTQSKQIEVKKDFMDNENYEIATLGGGCFWCVEAVYDQLQGVISATSGYTGGTVENPTYKQVCEGDTGHAEVVQIVFDPKLISYDELLDVFWVIHDPTQLNRQGNDIGTQYRSSIFYHSEEQKLIAQRSIQQYEASKMYPNAFTTTVEPLEVFYPAEDYHQEYYENNSDSNPYCSLVVAPKIQKFYEKFYDKLKPEYK